MSIEEEIIYKLIEQGAKTRADFVRAVGEVYSKYKVKGYRTNIVLRDTYDAMLETGVINENLQIEKLLITKKMRSLSGVSVITVLTKPYDCPGKCIYCPTEQDVPKSYLSNEPAVMRAILNKYDAKDQVVTRLDSLARQGHPIDKVELIVIGGTFNFLPKEYQESFVKECFDALNGFDSVNLSEAKTANEKAKSRCVGLTLETRPDFITEKEVAWFRYLGATRIEMGVQTIFDDVLRLNARGHDVAETVRATKLLKNAGFKINYHLMPNLYGSNLDRDKEMFLTVFDCSDFKPDYIKIYPCMVMAGTPLLDLYEKNEYIPYTDKELIDLISDVKKHIPYWIRIMRTIRDIPAQSIVAGSKVSNLRQLILANAKTEGWSCNCIRCREAMEDCGDETELFVEEYEASEGKEFFLSFEDKERKTLYSLLRLRFPRIAISGEQIVLREPATPDSHAVIPDHKPGISLVSSEGDPRVRKDDKLLNVLPELEGCALIREVHTYGQQIEIGEAGDTQHKGFGRKLIVKAEEIARENGFLKIAVISGVGVRSYYEKFGYTLVGEYMIKKLK